MTDTDLAPTPAAVSTRTKTIWAGSIALAAGLYVLSASVLIFPALALGALLLFIAPIYAIVTLVQQSNRRKRGELSQPSSEAGSDIADRAAHFSTVPQVLTLVASAGWLLSWLVVAIFALIAAATPTPANAVYQGTFLGLGYFFLLGPLAALGALGLAATIPYDYSRSVRAGEQAALLAKEGAYQLIRFARRVNHVLLWLAAVGPLLLIVWALIDQSVLVTQINSGELN
jgi:hypothetical protein